MAVVRGLDRYDGRAAFSTWSYRVVTNACLDELRRRKRRPDPFQPTGDEQHPGLEDVAGSPGPAATDGPAAVDARLTVEQALRRLPPEYAEAVVLRDLVDLDYRQISEALGVPVGTVRSRIARGRERLSEILRNQDDVDERRTPRDDHR